VPRQPGEGLLAFYWDGGTPVGHRVRDISRHGAFIETGNITWPCGSILLLTLQMDPLHERCNGVRPIVIEAEIVRLAGAGMGLRFLFRTMSQRRMLQQFLSKWVSRSAARGQSLLEFALIFPLLFLLIVNVVNFGTFMYAWITVSSAARAGCQYWITGGSTVYGPSTPTAAQVTAVITKEIAALKNRSSLTVEVCTKNKSSGTAVVTCSGTYGAITPVDDAEPTSFVSATVDVAYTYQPAIPLWTFSSLNIHATIPTTTIHRRAVMRLMN
jgi:Flp pilus assembly protein TadG